MSKNYHKPVLVAEIINQLPNKGSLAVADLTLGGGGHSLEIITKLNSLESVTQLKLDTFDLDETAYKIFRTQLAKVNLPDSFQLEIEFFQENFVELVKKDRKYDLILADLGLSQNQLARTDKGFSYNTKISQPLDMRLDPKLNVTASDLLQALPFKQLNKLFGEYANIKPTADLSRGIIRVREKKKIETNLELKKVVAETIGEEYLAQVFQALRIAVNTEYESLETLVTAAPSMLKRQGKLLVISFHSGEERVISRAVKENSQLKLTQIKPSSKEVDSNPRARSAKLHIIEFLV